VGGAAKLSWRVVAQHIALLDRPTYAAISANQNARACEGAVSMFLPIIIPSGRDGKQPGPSGF